MRFGCLLLNAATIASNSRSKIKVEPPQAEESHSIFSYSRPTLNFPKRFSKSIASKKCFGKKPRILRILKIRSRRSWNLAIIRRVVLLTRRSAADERCAPSLNFEISSSGIGIIRETGAHAKRFSPFSSTHTTAAPMLFVPISNPKMFLCVIKLE